MSTLRFNYVSSNNEIKIVTFREIIMKLYSKLYKSNSVPVNGELNSNYF